MIEKQLERFVLALELFVSAALIVVAIMLVVALGFDVLGEATDGLGFDRESFTLLISRVLEVFIVIELFRVALAYITHRNVIPIVFEAALVALARKLIVFEPQGDVLASSLGLAVLLLALGISWWLVGNAGGLKAHGESKP